MIFTLLFWRCSQNMYWWEPWGWQKNSCLLSTLQKHDSFVEASWKVSCFKTFLIRSTHLCVLENLTVTFIQGGNLLQNFVDLYWNSALTTAHSWRVWPPCTCRCSRATVPTKCGLEHLRRILRMQRSFISYVNSLFHR